MNASIGLALFKLTIGCTALLRNNFDDSLVETLDTDTLTTDALILHYPKSGEVITEATLCATALVCEKYKQLLQYEKQLKVSILIRP